ncbi:MAG: hypothetical protein AB1428_14755 [Bacteroidota bacterium]
MTMTVSTRSTFLLCALFAGTAIGLAQSGRQFTRTGIMNGNQVRTVFGNWGIIGQPANEGKRGAWRSDNNGYLGDVSPLVGAEVKFNGLTFHSVETCPFYPTQRPAASQDVDQDGNFSTFEPVGGYFNANQDRVAQSTNFPSWPPFWPDKLNDATDPGWKGSWNGYFGKRINADQEAYFVMDDNNDKRFNDARNNRVGGVGVSFKPDSTNLQRNGLGLEIRVRAMQWAQFLAKDNIFWLYEITNTGTTNYDKAVFGMLVGTYVGVTSTEDYREYSDDFSFYSVKDNITYTGDFKAINGQKMSNPLWIGGTGLVGYAFLESPGNPFDGIDNDGDADSTAFGISSPKFTETDFDSVTLTPGKRIVLINPDFSRSLFTIPNVDSLKLWTRGLPDSIWIYPGRTRLAEGNLVSLPGDSTQRVNPNARDGIDNNFNGLIDENYFVHYRQVKRSRTGTLLINQLRPLRHIDYVAGLGTSPLSMLDERRDDGIDNNLDWSLTYDDLGRDGVANTNDFGEGDGKPTSGYDLNGFDSGLPGEPHVDKTDVRESDQIGLTSFFYFAPANNVRLGDKEWLWTNLSPGFFDVPPSIVFNPATLDSRPITGEDGDFFYGSGYFPLLAKRTERFSLALVYGGGQGGGLDADLRDLLKNKRTVQDIYNANYQFPQAPDKPTLTAVPDDRQVTLYWDRKSEVWIDPVLRKKTFEGYKIYKSTSPDFSDKFTITDAAGVPQGYTPLAQFDLVDGIKDIFQPSPALFQATSGFPFYLGSDNGLQHTYVDKSVENGRRYFYAIVSYTKGDPAADILPAENTKFISIQPDGSIIHDVNVAVVVPNTKTAGYVPPPDGVALSHVSIIGTGTASYRVVDPRAITGNRYRVEFLDSQLDSVDVFGNVRVISTDTTRWERKTTSYSVRDLREYSETITFRDTTLVILGKKNLVPSSVILRNAQGSTIQPSEYLVDLAVGNIRAASVGSLPAGQYTLSYQYYPVYRSPNVQGSPYLSDSKDADNFDGIQLVFQNDWSNTLIDTLSRWTGKNPYVFSFAPFFTTIGPPVQVFRGYRKPSDYRIEFANTVVDSSYEDPILYPFAIPVNFRVYNVTDSTFIKFIFADNDANGVLSPADELVFVEKDPFGRFGYTWDMVFTAKQGDPPDTVYILGAGVRLDLRTRKSFRRGDQFEFSTVVPSTDVTRATAELSRVKVVPNPYITAAEFELPLNPGITSGRGQRRIDFIHVPSQSVISIFTARGDHVITLRHDSGIEDGTVSWNLKTRENLDIAYGIYFYVLESPVGNKTGKIAIIK